MNSPFRLVLAALLAGLPFAAFAAAQALPASGVQGFDDVYATSPAGTSQFLAINPGYSPAPIPIGPPVPSVPSRWAHRRRTLGALETKITYLAPVTFVTPMGDAVGNGSLHLVDARGRLQTSLVATGNPAAYDVAAYEPLRMVFVAEDDGAGNTILRGFSYATPGTLVPLNPPFLTLAGSPCAYVNRMGVDESGARLLVPTVSGIHEVTLFASGPQLVVTHFFNSGSYTPSTNPTSFDRQGTRTWIIGTCRFAAISNSPKEAGYLLWDHLGITQSGVFGAIPSNPSKSWVPGAGTEELAVVGDGTDTYVYYLLREPLPGTFFIKPSAVGVVRILGSATPAVSFLPCPDDCGEPFANPAVHGTRVAFESSLGPPFWFEPPGGAEKVNILYTPLDPLGSSTVDGQIAVPGPLGGRISTKGADRPLWSHDGTRVITCTSHFPGAPSPALPGIEVLDVPAAVPVDEYVSPHCVVQNATSPNQSIIYPARFDPRDPAAAAFLDGLTFAGNVFHDGMAGILTHRYGEIGHKQFDSFTQSSAVPGFPAILPPSFDDPNGSLTPIPRSFGARRATFNLTPALGLSGLVMTAAIGNRILVQPAGINHLAALGQAIPEDPVVILLPYLWITTTEFLSL